MTDPIRIANCSGFFGDRPSGALEMVEGGPIDVLTGDWLAELTMLILSRIRAKRPGQGYARTFVGQMEQVMGTCLDRGIKVVSNAGGLDPDGCAEAVQDVADKLGLSPTIAYVNGDDLLPRLHDLAAAGALRPLPGPDDADGLGDLDAYVSANAYLGCFGIVDALTRGADIVITGRVTDAAVVCGPAAWHHNWEPHHLDALAGGVVAGHLIECSAQVTGGNYSFFGEIPTRGERPRFGFPWAEVAADGSAVIGKHDETGGEVSIGTVTSQLLYEIGAPEYLGPDVTARFDTVQLEQIGPDRVRVSGTRGLAPPSTLKVAMNEFGGYRNSFTVALTGLDIDAKAELAQAAFWDASSLGPDDFESISSTVVRTDKADPETQEEATAIWRLTVKDRDERKVGRAFSDANVHTALSSIPGMYGLGGGPAVGQPFGVYRPAIVPSDLVPQYVTVLGGATAEVPSGPGPNGPSVAASVGVGPSGPGPDGPSVAASVDVGPLGPGPDGTSVAASVDVGPLGPGPDGTTDGPTARVPLGRIVGARSGDKGGNANVGVFVRSSAAWEWLDAFLTVDRFTALLPETADLLVERFRLPNVWALNFVVHGLLDEGVAASTRQDAQAKAVGEWLRSRVVDVPTALLDRP